MKRHWQRAMAQARPLFRIARPILGAHWTLLVLCLGLSLLLTCLELLRPQALRLLFDGLLTPNAQQLPAFLRDMADREVWPWTHVLGVVCGMVISISIAIALINYFLEVRLAYLGNKVTSRLRKQVFRHLIALPNLFHDTQKTGDLVLRLTGDILMIRDLLVTFVISFVGRGTLIGGMVLMMALMNLRLTLVALLLIPALVFLTMRASGRVTQISRRQRENEAAVAQSIHEIIGEMRVFAAYGRRDLEDERFDHTNRRSFKNDVKGRRVQARLAGITELTLAGGTCAAIGMGVLEIQYGRMSAGELLVFLAYLRTLFKPIRILSSLTGRSGKAMACSERVMDILRTPVTLADTPDAVPLADEPLHVIFRDVELSYGGKSPALRGLTFSIKPGEILGITGPSGSGKSSLCMLLPRLYEADGGQILLNGAPLEAWTLESLRSRVCLVLQDAGLFDMSLAENVAFGLVDCPNDRIVSALHQAELQDLVARLPEGLQTMIGERGMRISGGERRRVALARALVRQPRILVLDEPFEGLDHATAESIRQTILRLAGERTILIVSHQPFHLAGCTRLIRLEQGRMVSDEPISQDAQIVELSADA